MANEPWVCEPLIAAEALSRPRFAMPEQACDCHMHVFGPAERYSAVPNARYLLPEGDLEAYRARARILRLQRCVFVQPSFYGTDNACMLDAMRHVGESARGVIFLPPSAPASLLDDYHRLGVRGLRLDLFKADEGGEDFSAIVAKLDSVAAVARHMGWHIELYSPGRITYRLLEHLARLDVDISINHLGYMTKADGLTDADFGELVSFVASSRCWVKLTAPYRVDKNDSTERSGRMARELVAKAPHRLLWGSDWPHIPEGSMDTGELLNRLADWCPSEAIRNRILVTNPARFYQFE